MTVRELIEMLKEEDFDRVVVMARDAEGNRYSPLSSMWRGSYLATTTWYGEAGFEGLSPEMMEQGYSEEDLVDGEKALILCPVN